MGGFLWGFAGTSDDSTALYPTRGVAAPQVYGSVAAPRAVRVYVPDGTDARDDVERGKRALRHKFMDRWPRYKFKFYWGRAKAVPAAPAVRAAPA